MNVFEAVKQSVTTRQAAEHYGIRVGRNGMACCPFHKDRTPSMKVDNRYYCFGCGETGDVIDFVASLHNLEKRDAAIRLSQDFGIVYDECSHRKANFPVKKTVPKLTFEQKYEQTKTKCIRVLLDYRHLLRSWKDIYVPKSDDETWHPRFCEALQNISSTEYLLDILLFGETEEQAAVIAEQGKKVMELEQRIREVVFADETETIRNNGFDGVGTDSGGNSGNAGLYTERFSEKQPA